MALQSRENVLVLWLIPIHKTVQLKGMQTSKQGMWKGHHFSIEGIRKRYLFREKKNGIKNGKWLDLGAESPRINICWVPPGGVLLVYINDNLFCCCCCLFLQIIVEYPKPKNTLCIVRLWFRHIGFGLAFTSLLLKTWRFVWVVCWSLIIIDHWSKPLSNTIIDHELKCLIVYCGENLCVVF